MTEPQDICHKCWKNELKTSDSPEDVVIPTKTNWEKAVISPETVWWCPWRKPQNTRPVADYPPPYCPWKLELLLLKDKGHPVPQKAH